MKFTTMQKALSMGAIGAVAAGSAQATIATNNGNQELVLYVTATGGTAADAAYARGLQVQLTQIAGNYSVAGVAQTGTYATTAGMVMVKGNATTSSLYLATQAANISGASLGTVGVGTQSILKIDYTLPTVMADANLTSFLSAASAAGQTVKWSIQAGSPSGNGANASRVFVTTASDNWDTGTAAQVGSLGMDAVTANVWGQIGNVVASVNTAMTTAEGSGTTTLDGHSVLSNAYLTTVSNGYGANTWFGATTPTTNIAPNPLSDVGSSANFYAIVSNGSTAGNKNWAFTLNDVTMDTVGNLNYTSAPPVPVPGAAWLLLSGLGGLGVIGRKKKTS